MTKSNRNPNKIILPPFLRGVAALLSLTFVISWGIPALAVSPEIRIDETRTLLEDSDTKGEGYLVVEASTPVGFEGILCVELQKKVSSGKVTIQISPADYYIGGQYMEPGTYIVRKAYALNDETAIVEADREEITVATDGDTHLQLTVETDPAAEEAWLAMMETYTLPELPTEETTESTESFSTPTEETPGAEETEEATQSQQLNPTYAESSIVKTILKLLKSLALTAIFGGAVYFFVEKLRK